MERHLLQNKVKVLYYPVPHSFSITIGLVVKVGSRNETPTNNGISHLLEHMHFRRLGELTQHELYHLTDTMGTTLEASTYTECTRYHMRIRPQFLREGIKLFEKILTMDQWTEADLECEKRVVLSELGERENGSNPIDMIDRMRFGESSMALHVIGNADSIQRISLNELLAYKAKYYCSQNIFFVVTGQCSPEDIAYLDDVISNINIQEGMVTENPPYFVGRKKAPKVQVVFDNDGFKYATVNIFFEVPMEAKHEAFILLNSIVGGGTTSLLQKKVREEMGLTYDLYSDEIMFSDVKFFGITYSTKIGNLYSSLEAIVKILAGVSREVTDDDMATNLPFFTDDLWYWLENTEELNWQLTWKSLQGRECAIEELIRLFGETSKNEIRELAQQIFVASKASVLIAGATRNLRKKQIRTIFENYLPT